MPSQEYSNIKLKDSNNPEENNVNHDLELESNGRVRTLRPPRGCYLTRTQGVLLFVTCIVVIILIGLLAGLLGRKDCGPPESIPVKPFRQEIGPTSTSTRNPPPPWQRIRLPRTLIPSLYELSLRIDLTKFVFKGAVNITIRVAQSTKHVLIHMNKLSIHKSQVSLKEMKSKNSVNIINQFYYADKQFYVLELAEYLVLEGKYVLSFDAFEGNMTDEMRGLYRSSYKLPNGETR